MKDLNQPISSPELIILSQVYITRLSNLDKFAYSAKHPPPTQYTTI